MGPSGITQLIAQVFSDITEVNFITPIHSLRMFGVKDGVIFLRGTRQGGVIFLGIELINSSEIIW